MWFIGALDVEFVTLPSNDLQTKRGNNIYIENSDVFHSDNLDSIRSNNFDHRNAALIIKTGMLST